MTRFCEPGTACGKGRIRRGQIMKEEDHNKLFENLPDCAVEFIRLVIRKMGYRREVRAEVRAELVGHFEDGLRDCKSEQEREERARELIADFGDVRLLGVLLRRAKKRCRPLWRTLMVRAFQGLGVLILCLVLYVVWFLTGTPKVTTNYVAQFNRIVRPSADESLNAAPLYDRAVEVFTKIPDELDEVMRGDREASADERVLIEEWLDGNAEALELAVAGSKKPYYWRDYAGKQNTGEMMAVLLPHLSEFRNIGHGLCSRARFRAEQGRYAEAFSDIESCYRMGRQMKGDKTLIEQLVGIAVEAVAVKNLRDILSAEGVDLATLASLQQRVEEMMAGENFSMSFKGEKLFLYDEIQRCFTEDRFGGGHLYLKRFREIGDMTDDDLMEMLFRKKRWLTPLHVLFTHPNKSQTRETADEYYGFIEEMAAKTPARLRAEEIDLNEKAMEIVRGNVLLDILAPAIGKAAKIGHRMRVDAEATAAIIALLRYEKDKGVYPDNPGVLVSGGYLKELPIDPFSDKPLVYRRTDDGFILYSVSENFEDDGGEVGRDRKGKVRLWGETGDAVFWPVIKP